MDHAPTIIISLILGVLLGVGGMYAYLEFNETREYSDVVSTHSTISFDECKRLPSQDQAFCANQIVSQKAIKQVDATICDDITLESQRTSCKETVTRIQQFDATNEAFCEGYENRVFCQDLMHFLSADLRQDRDICASIQFEDLRTQCIERLPGDPEEDLATQEALAGQFGPLCPTEEVDCLTDAEQAKQAILSGNLNNCLNAGFFRELCVTELDLYRLSQGEGVNGCDAFPENPPQVPVEAGVQSTLTQVVCRMQLTMAAAIEQGNTGICTDLQEASLVSACTELVGQANEGRFEYLAQ